MEVKVPFYNILNIFLIGLVFIGGCLIIFPDTVVAIFSSDIIKTLGAGPEIVITVCTFAVAYEVGLIINRTGSVILEPILKKIKFIPFNDNYTLFNQKKKEYPIMNTLSREYALSRTGIALFLSLLILSAVEGKRFLVAIYAVVTGIYFLSCRKHAGKIVELMQNG
ncbi:hypothetical protein KTH81_10530 [Lachnospiraceae bacterium ASD3451]|uniref:hypothetical protein n=1 Tax=Diplocloster agilis TaxID=2850323 RepID=UPI001D456568|nr:hypothetical protein [Diplocloster agilis]MBU9744256.1 hypothetical protein [Diplocloster agilis]